MQKRVLVIALSLVIVLSIFTPYVADAQTIFKTPTNPLDSIIPPNITNYTIFQGNPDFFSLAAHTNSTISLPFFDKTIEIRPKERQLLASDYTSLIVDEHGVFLENPAPQISTFQGSIDGDSGSWINIITTKDSIRGNFVHNQKPYTIEPLTQYTNRTDYSNFHIIYPHKNPDPESIVKKVLCESIKVDTIESEDKILTSGSSGTLLCRLALAIDKEAYDLWGSSWETEILLVINGIDNIYADQIDTAFSVTTTIAFLSGLTPTDPYQLLPAFKNKMIETDKSTYMPRDTAHLFSGKDFDGDYIGLAYEPGLNNEMAYGISQMIGVFGSTYTGSLWDRQMLVAHEIGHNFFGQHAEADYWYIFGIARFSIMWETYMGLLQWPAFSDGTGWLAGQQGDHDNVADMLIYASGHLVDWSPDTIPNGNYYNFYTIDFDAVGGRAYHIDTKYGSTGGYTFFGYTSSHTYRVRPDGKLHFTGWFRQYDTFSSQLQPGRRKLLVYAITPDTNQILGYTEILDYQDGTDWYYIEDDCGGLTPGQEVRFAVGRPDSWDADWELTAEWAGVTVYGQYSGRTSPTGKHFRFYVISTTYGDGYHIDSRYSSQYGYNFYGYTGETFTVGQSGTIYITGYFRQYDTFSEIQAPGRRYLDLYLLDLNGDILDSLQILDYTHGTDWTWRIGYFFTLDAGSYRIGIGRRDAWSSDYQLTAEWTNVEITAVG